MKKITVIIILTLLSLNLLSQDKYVYLGELIPEKSSYEYIRFDGDGELYPDFNIPENNKNCFVGVKKSGMVKQFYEKKCTLRNKILSNYNIDSTLAFRAIQTLIVRKKIDEINAQLKEKRIDNVTFIMVGFNNHYKCNPDTPTECAKFKLDSLRNTINRLLGSKNQKTLVVELFWDGLETQSEGVQTFLNLSSSSRNSYWVGLGLREIINGLNCDKINLISHSMGANIITESIFNQKTKTGSALNAELAPYRKIPLDSTKKINAGIIAAAIPGINTFIDYLNPKTNNKNCRFIIGFNHNDTTLRKAVKGVPNSETITKHFSSTSLGCLKSEVDSVQKMFLARKNMGTMYPIDFSLYNGKPQGKHDLLIYMKEPEYEEMLKLLYEIR